MTAAVPQQDRGLQAVRRVRAAREQDSRVGLARAVAEHEDLCDRVSGLAAGLDVAAHESPDDRAFASFAVHRAHLSALGAQLVSARAAAEAARRVVESSREHWMADHRRLESVENLLQRRADERRHEQTRRTARDDDEVAVTLWRRTAGAGEGA